MVNSPHRFPPASADWRRLARPRASGFTLVEVMVAAVVLIFAITTAILTLQRGLQSLDVARTTTYASQVMQTEFENLRLKSWQQLQELQNAGAEVVIAESVPGAVNATFRCLRSIRDLKMDMKEIALVSTWRGYDGREQTLRYVTRYGKSGLYDYFYTAH